MNNEEEKQVQEESVEQGFGVEEALRCGDWELLRTLSLKPGGFGSERSPVWSFLVQANTARTDEDDFEEPLHPTLRRRKQSVSTGHKQGDSDPDGVHPDEHQIKLDTDRSFVLYPSEEQRDRTDLQSDLNALITSIFREHPRLNYFQGYHDIVTVIFLTLPENNRLRVCEKLSLHRLRDAMGTSLEPIIALLRILKLLLRLADKQFSELLERDTPLPYFALSNLLTTFSHDVPTLPLIQHIFDYLLCRAPIASVYLIAAITLARKDEAELLEEDEEGMLHSLLSSLPELLDDTPESSADATTDKIDNEGNPLEDMTSIGGDELPPLESNLTAATLKGELIEGGVVAKGAFVEDSGSMGHSKVEPGQIEQDVAKMENSLDDSEEAGTADFVVHSSPTTPGDSQPRAKRKILYLPQILKQADELLTRFPPSHPDLHLSSILGPQSVVFTWSEDRNDLMSDDEAEEIVSHPELVVLPYQDPDEARLHENRKQDDHVPSQKNPRRERQFRLDTRTMLLTGVAVAGIAVAVYSLKSRGSRGKVDELKKAGQWFAELFDAKVYPF